MTREEAFAAARQFTESDAKDKEESFRFEAHGMVFFASVFINSDGFCWVSLCSGNHVLMSFRPVSRRDAAEKLAWTENHFAKNSACLAVQARLAREAKNLASRIIRDQQKLQSFNCQIEKREMTDKSSQDAKLLASAGF